MTAEFGHYIAETSAVHPANCCICHRAFTPMRPFSFTICSELPEISIVIRSACVVSFTSGELSQPASSHSRCVRLTIGAEMSSALRILIVDDSDVTRRILCTIVRSRHWTVCGEAEAVGRTTIPRIEARLGFAGLGDAGYRWHTSRSADVRYRSNCTDNPFYSIGPGGPGNARTQGRNLCRRVESAGLESAKEHRDCAYTIPRIISVSCSRP
jgi:hypothetical protein